MSGLFDSIQLNASNIVNIVIYAAIAAVTLIGVFRCLVPLWTTTAALHRAIRRLEDNASITGGKPIWQEPKFMGRRLKGCWLRFLQNAEQLDRRGLPCNVEDYINDDTVTHGPGNATLAELIPSLLTSLGILGTFIGMTQGLSGLDISNNEVMMSGIQHLLQGMQFAFGTSVAGVACSLLFNMLNRILQGASYRAIDDFTDAFTQLAMQRPLDNDVQLICQNQDRNHLLGEVTETVSSSMATSIELAIGRAMQPVAASMDRFLVGATKAQVEGVGRIADQFIEHMNRSLDGQFLSLAKTINSLNQREMLNAENFRKSTASVNTIIGDVDRLHTISGEVITRFQEYVNSINAANSRDEHFEKNALDLLSTMRQAQNEQHSLMEVIRAAQNTVNQSMADFQSNAEKTVSNMQIAAQNSAGSMKQISENMQKSSSDLSASYQHFVQDVVEGVSRALGMFQQNMNAFAGVMAEQTRKAAEGKDSGAMTAEISAIQQTLADVKAILTEGNGAEKPHSEG